MYLPRGISLIRSQNVYNDGFHAEGLVFIGDEHAAQLAGVEVEAGDVLLNITGDSVARSCRAPAGVLPARVNQHVAIIRPNPDELDPRYLHYHLISPVKQAEMLSLAGAGATRNALTKGMIENFEVPAPSPDEQRAIASVLGALDDKIEQNRRTAQALEKLARAIFRAWFVDYEPVKAKAAGATGFPSMPQSVFDALPTRFVDSAIGPVPEGWEVKAVNDLCDYISSGGTPARRRPEFWANGTIDWFKTGELQDGPLLVSSERITEKGLDNSSAKLWPSGTVLFALYASPTVGRLGVLTRPGTSNQAAAGLIAKSEVGVPFLMNALIEARAELQRIAVGAAQQNINQGVLKSHQMVLPPSELTRAYSGAMNSALEMRIALAEEAAKLSELRDYLLPKLLSGQVRVRDAERKAASVA